MWCCAIEIRVVLKIYQKCKDRKINNDRWFLEFFDKNGQDA